MKRALIALATLYRRWRYVEEEEALPAAVAAAPEGGELLRIRRSILLEEERVADCRRNGRMAMARERESTLRSLKSRLFALEMDQRRTA